MQRVQLSPTSAPRSQGVHSLAKKAALKRLLEIRGEKSKYDWSLNARPDQIAPPGDWTIFLLMGGRGAGKTRSGAEWVRKKIEAGLRRGGIVAPTASDARDVMIEGESGILNIFPNKDRPKYEPSKRRITFKTGAVVHVYSGEDPTRFRGPQHEFMWCDEICYYPDPVTVWETLMLGLRLGKHPQIMATTTPRPIKLIRDLVKRDGEDVIVRSTSTYANLDNLAPSFRRQVLARFEGTRLAKQEIEGLLLEDVEGALWQRKFLQYIDIKEVPQLTRVGVGLDPSISAKHNADEAGIIAAGIGPDINDPNEIAAYVLEDKTRRCLPEKWARTAVGLFDKHEGDFIAAETNQGGEMVRSTLKLVDSTVPIKMVHASRGKILRAEPVSALYEQGRVYHVSGLDPLETEMLVFDGTGPSPNRLDALVYVLTELMLKSRAVRWDVF